MADHPPAPPGGETPPRPPSLARRLLDQLEPTLGPLEGDYRRHYLPTDVAQALVASRIAIGALIFFACIDFVFFGWGPILVRLLLLRAALIAVALVMFRQLRQTTEPLVADRLILLSEALLMAGAVYVSLSRPPTYWQGPTIDVLLVISFYTLIPQPLPHRLLAGVGSSLFSAAVLLLVKVGIPPLTLLIALTGLILANVLGLVVSTRLFNQRRDQYQALIDQRAAQAALEWLATTDSLTGLPNRRSFLAAAEQELARYLRHGHVFAILIIDLDRFKDINDTFGHQAGDYALKGFAALVSGLQRRMDSLGRLGGEEFGLLMPETNLAEARLVAERLRARCQALNLVADGAQLPLTLSAGLAQATPADANLDSLIRRADEALYRAKQAGRNRVAVAE